jgi:hypothetical protein
LNRAAEKAWEKFAENIKHQQLREKQSNDVDQIGYVLPVNIDGYQAQLV